MSHGNARTTVHGRLLMVRRHQAGKPKAHIAAAMGISRKCVATWISRYVSEGEADLHDRSSRPHTPPTRTRCEVEQHVLELRRVQRRGQDWIGPEIELAPRTVGRILRRHQVPYLRELDRLTGALVRASKTTAVRYERDRPGELVHMDVKKLGQIPDGGGWRAHGREAVSITRARSTWVGFDYVHSMVHDHSRLAHSQGPSRREGRHLHGVPGSGRGLPRRLRDHPLRPGDDRQRLGLPEVVAGGRGSGGCQAGVHPPALSLAERESRALQPHPGDRMGLPASLHIQRRTRWSPRPVDRALQHWQTPQHPRRPPISRLRPIL
jgi:transposase